MIDALRTRASRQPQVAAPRLLWLHSDLDLAVARTATTFRAMWVIGAVATTALWATVAGLPKWPVITTAIAIVWIGTLAWLVRERKVLPAWIAVVDATLFALLMAAQALLVPPDLIGDGSTWVWNGACISILIACWLLRPWDAIAITVAIALAAYIGIGLAGRLPLTLGYAMTISILVLQTFAGLVSIRTIRGAVSRADAAVERQNAVERAKAVDDNRNRLRDELENQLHDDVKTTLYTFGAGFVSDPAQARAKAANAVASIEQLRTGAHRASRQSLATALTEVVEAARADGFDVVLNIDQRANGTGWWPRRRTEPREGWLPRAAIDAVAGAAAQALANARAYAGVGVATVDLVVRPGRFAVTVRDLGVGFDASDESRFGSGIPRSILGRMREVGGDAQVESFPGADTSGRRGTTWRLTWDGGAVEARRRAQPRRIADEAITEYGHGFVLMFLVLAIFFHALSLYPVLFQQDDYYSWPTAVGCWTLNLAVIAYLLGKVTSRSQVPMKLARVMGLAIVVGAVAVALNCRPSAVLGFANWALSDSVWLLILVGIYSKVREAIAGAGVILATTCLAVMANLAPEASTVVKLVGVVVSTAVIQVGAAFAVTFVRRATQETARTVWQTSEIVAERIAGDVAGEHGKNLYIQLDHAIVELLQHIADGTKDVNEPAVQAECRRANDLLRQASRLRRDGAHDLIPLLNLAASRALTIDFAYVERLDRVPARLTTHLLDCLRQVVNAAKPGMAVLSIQSTVDVSDAGAAKPITATLQVPIEPGSGEDLRRRFRIPVAVKDIAVDLDLYDSEGNSGDATASLAMMKAVLHA